MYMYIDYSSAAAMRRLMLADLEKTRKAVDDLADIAARGPHALREWTRWNSHSFAAAAVRAALNESLLASWPDELPSEYESLAERAAIDASPAAHEWLRGIVWRALRGVRRGSDPTSRSSSPASNLDEDCERAYWSRMLESAPADLLAEVAATELRTQEEQRAKWRAEGEAKRAAEAARVAAEDEARRQRRAERRAARKEARS